MTFVSIRVGNEEKENMSKDSKVRILMCGGALKGNMGAPAMYDSIIDEMSKHIPEPEVTVLSKYPNDDKEECTNRGYRMIAFPTIRQLIDGGCFFVFGGFLKLLHLPFHWLAKKNAALEAYFSNDILIDASGISFTDDRSFSNILINTLWFLPAIVSGIPMVKMSQSMGPFEKGYVKSLGRLVLNRLDFIVCRGDRSYELTKAFLKKKNIYNLPDTAFCLKPAEDRERLLNNYGLAEGEYIAVGPSFVMRDYFEKGVYSDIVSNALNRITELTDRKLLFVPHSWIHSAQLGADSVNDDLTVCREVASKLDRKDYVIISDEMSARQLKAMIYMAIGSRYHFLIAALSSGVPSMALGWSHKYRELFKEFGIDEYVLEYSGMDLAVVQSMAEKLFAHRDEVKEKIDENLDDVKQRSAMNEKLVVELLEKKGLL